MATQLNAELLAQMANDQIEVNEVANILDGMYDEMPCDEPEDRDYMRLFAANRLGKANDLEISKFKKAIIGLLQRPNDHSPQTVCIGTRMVKFYYSPSYHFERVFLPELTDDQLELPLSLSMSFASGLRSWIPMTLPPPNPPSTTTPS